MAKFAVGEIALHTTTNTKVKIMAVGPWKYGEKCSLVNVGDGIAKAISCNDDYAAYFFEDDGLTWYVDEKYLRKLPPDDHADDATEEPGLTRLKKLLEQDTVPHKQTKREKA